MKSVMTEQEIIKRCIKNDRSAQKDLYKKYAAIMMALCMRYTGNRAEAEDVLQEGFLKIFLNMKDYAGTGSFEGWMKRIIINTAITHYHKNLKHNMLEDIELVQKKHIVDQEYNDLDFSHEELMGVISTLPDGYRMVFNLFAIEGYKHKDIAEMLKIDINTSKSQFSRARKLIQKKLEELKAS